MPIQVHRSFGFSFSFTGAAYTLGRNIDCMPRGGMQRTVSTISGDRTRIAGLKIPCVHHFTMTAQSAWRESNSALPGPQPGVLPLDYTLNIKQEMPFTCASPVGINGYYRFPVRNRAFSSPSCTHKTHTNDCAGIRCGTIRSHVFLRFPSSCVSPSVLKQVPLPVPVFYDLFHFPS